MSRDLLARARAHTDRAQASRQAERADRQTQLETVAVRRLTAALTLLGYGRKHRARLCAARQPLPAETDFYGNPRLTSCWSIDLGEIVLYASGLPATTFAWIDDEVTVADGPQWRRTWRNGRRDTAGLCLDVEFINLDCEGSNLDDVMAWIADRLEKHSLLEDWTVTP